MKVQPYKFSNSLFSHISDDTGLTNKQMILKKFSFARSTNNGFKTIHFASVSSHVGDQKEVNWEEELLELDMMFKSHKKIFEIENLMRHLV